MKPTRAQPSARFRFWRRLIEPLLRRQTAPFYLFSIVPVVKALAELDQHWGRMPVRSWLSCKTQPLRPLLQWWRRQGRSIEVVSEFEFLAARQEGFPPEHILLNGPAKHHWLTRHPVPGLRVNLDSTAEAKVLIPYARRLGWSVGVRLLTAEEFDPESPACPTQFGLAPREAVPLLRTLIKSGLTVETVHVHLRTNVARAAVYQRALEEAAAICRQAGFAPRFVDCGGGFPPPDVRTSHGRRVDADFDLRSMAGVLRGVFAQFPSAREVWLENGRWLSARSGVLVVRVLDVKERRSMRHLICNGGRTLHALVAQWEDHDLFLLPDRRGGRTSTTVSGPTCMAFDRLARRPLPRTVREGDHVVWMEAGAYHLPWETRFSHGHASIFWHDGRRIRCVRRAETFAEWWGLNR